MTSFLQEGRRPGRNIVSTGTTVFRTYTKVHSTDQEEYVRKRNDITVTT